jgi:hypothetical protein
MYARASGRHDRGDWLPESGARRVSLALWVVRRPGRWLTLVLIVSGCTHAGAGLPWGQPGSAPEPFGFRAFLSRVTNLAFRPDGKALAIAGLASEP